MNIDLHTHSNYSDGSLTPSELLETAAAAGVEVMALTDHDTVAGVVEAHQRAVALGVELVPGVEISAAWRSQTIHILGLWIDPCGTDLLRQLSTQEERRRIRMAKICRRLTKVGLPGAELLAVVQESPGVPTRAHLAHAMVAGGCVASPDQAFRKYLGSGKSGYVAAEWPTVAEVVGWICAAGGVASLAHPARYALSGGARRQLMTDFTAAGGAAIEVVAGPNGAHHVEASSMLAVSYGLMGSVGSDFHNPQFSWNSLGRSLKLPDCVTPVWRRHPYQVTP